MSFGANIKKLLVARNMSVRELAIQLSLPVASVNEWVGSKGRLPRDLEVFKKLAAFFGISTHELLYGEPDPKSFIGELLEKTEIHTGLYEISVKRVTPKKGVPDGGEP